MEIKIFTNEILLGVLFNLMGLKSRHAVTDNELEHYKKYLENAAEKQNIKVTYTYDMTENNTFIKSLIDTIIIDNKKIYRLKKSVTYEEIMQLVRIYDYYRSTHPNLNLGIDVINELTDYTSESEKECPEFQKQDETDELSIIYELYELEERKRKLEKKLEMVQSGETLMPTSELSQVFESNPEISKEEFIAKMQRR